VRVTELLVIVPTYNELDSVRGIIERIRASVPLADILVVDDASPDGTGELVDAIAAGDENVSVLHRAGKEGLGRAYLAGFAHGLAAGYSFIAEIDADGSHDPAELPRMLTLAQDGADLVIGSRWVAGGEVLNWPWYRSAISRGGNRYARFMLRSQVRDITAGFRVFRSSALRGLELAAVSSQGYCFQVEVAWRLEQSGARIIEHPITFIERASGVSKMHRGIVLEALVRVTQWGLGLRVRAANAERQPASDPDL
jgi:dolichol-phosphate mannosyltransferase